MRQLWVTLALLVCLVAGTTGCYVGGKKDENQIHVIHLGGENGLESDFKPEIVEIRIPEMRKKREAPNEEKKQCKTDKDCGEESTCDLTTSTCLEPANATKTELLDKDGPVEIKTSTHESQGSQYHSVISVNIERKHVP